MRAGWQKINRLKVEHESGRASVELVPAETGRCSRHFVVRVDGDWIFQSTYIRPFYSLESALIEAERRLTSG